MKYCGETKKKREKLLSPSFLRRKEQWKASKNQENKTKVHTEHFSRAFFLILRCILSSNFYYRTIDFIILRTHIRKNRLNNNELNFNYPNGVADGRDRERRLRKRKKPESIPLLFFLFFHCGFNVYFYFGYNFYCKRGKMIHHRCIWWFEPFVFAGRLNQMVFFLSNSFSCSFRFQNIHKINDCCLWPKQEKYG